jgi:hypothetical protein
METIKVYSPIEDKNIRTNLNNSPIWKQAYHEDEIREIEKQVPHMFEYSIKFDGLKPIMVNKVQKLY